MTLHDALFTLRRMEKYGPGVELSSTVRWYLRHGASIFESIVGGVLVPSVIISLGLFIVRAEILLALYVGMRGMMTYNQIASLALEREIDKALAESKNAPPVPKA